MYRSKLGGGRPLHHSSAGPVGQACAHAAQAAARRQRAARSLGGGL